MTCRQRRQSMCLEVKIFGNATTHLLHLGRATELLCSLHSGPPHFPRPDEMQHVFVRWPPDYWTCCTIHFSSPRLSVRLSWGSWEGKLQYTESIHETHTIDSSVCTVHSTLRTYDETNPSLPQNWHAAGGNYHQVGSH
jgi:hypothetical protein